LGGLTQLTAGLGGLENFSNRGRVLGLGKPTDFNNKNATFGTLLKTQRLAPSLLVTTQVNEKQFAVNGPALNLLTRSREGSIPSAFGESV